MLLMMIILKKKDVTFLALQQYQHYEIKTCSKKQFSLYLRLNYSTIFFLRKIYGNMRFKLAIAHAHATKC
jgi:hypothetical protein